MRKPTTAQLDAYLERVISRLADLQHVNLSAEAELQEALEESQHLLASMAMYRHRLKMIAQKNSV